MEFRVLPGEHSALGPSSAERWLNCPGSVRASEGIKDKESVFAAEGSAAHFLADHCFKEGKFAKDFIGAVIHVGTFSFKVDAEFAAAVQEYLDWCGEVDGTHLSEVRVNYADWIPGGFGTTDRVIFMLTRRCVIRDLKFGKGVQVYAMNNQQLMLYALGVLEEFGWAYDIDEFELGICQPRLDHKDTWVVSKEAILAWAERTFSCALEKIKCGTEFKAGAWCQFCRRKRDCAVRATQGLQEALADFVDLDALDAAKPKEITTLTPEHKAKILPQLGVLKAWIKDFERGVVADLINGVKIGGWKLVHGRANRKWADPDTAVKAMENWHVDPWKRTLISPAQAEEQLGKKLFKTTDLPGRIIKPAGKPVLASPEDSRDPITNDALNDFTNLDDEDE